MQHRKAGTLTEHCVQPIVFSITNKTWVKKYEIKPVNLNFKESIF